MIKAKLWGQIVEKLADLNMDAKEKIIRVKSLNDAILFKAEVIGVKGIICLENKSNEESEIVVKKVDPVEWKKLR
jgi:hypothetical protein